MKICIDPERDSREMVERVVDFWYGRNNKNGGGQRTLPEEKEWFCDDCGVKVSKTVKEFCSRRFDGAVFCMKCQKKHKEVT